MKIWKFRDEATIELFAKLAPKIRVCWGIGIKKWAIIFLSSAKR